MYEILAIHMKNMLPKRETKLRLHARMTNLTTTTFF